MGGGEVSQHHKKKKDTGEKAKALVQGAPNGGEKAGHLFCSEGKKGAYSCKNAREEDAICAKGERETGREKLSVLTRKFLEKKGMGGFHQKGFGRGEQASPKRGNLKERKTERSKITLLRGKNGWSTLRKKGNLDPQP